MREEVRVSFVDQVTNRWIAAGVNERLGFVPVAWSDEFQKRLG